MIIQCDCGQLKARIKNFPKETPGRLGCYCDDCQSYLIEIKRTDILDTAGCTEIIPVYPANIEIISGADTLTCLMLSAKGMFRWRASCCNSPIANVRAQFPWAGVMSSTLKGENRTMAQHTFPSIRSRIMGKFAKSQPVDGTPQSFDLKSMFAVAPFLFKGFLFSKYKPSPFFKSDNCTPIVTPRILSETERQLLRTQYLQSLTKNIL